MRYFFTGNSTTVVGGEIPYDSLFYDEEYAILYSPGRSVYKNTVEGSVYEPAKFIFGKVVEQDLNGFELEEIARISPRRK